MYVHLSSFGFERYVLDGHLLAKRWSFTFSGERTFDVDGKRLRFVMRQSLNEYHATVFWDDELIVSELFPEITEKLKRPRRGVLVRLAIWVIVGFIGMYVYNSYKSRQAASQDCPKPRTTIASRGQSCS